MYESSRSQTGTRTLRSLGLLTSIPVPTILTSDIEDARGDAGDPATSRRARASWPPHRSRVTSPTRNLVVQPQAAVWASAQFLELSTMGRRTFRCASRGSLRSQPPDTTVTARAARRKRISGRLYRKSDGDGRCDPVVWRWHEQKQHTHRQENYEHPPRASSSLIEVFAQRHALPVRLHRFITDATIGAAGVMQPSTK
jgi:hypothetical protein